jgi:putative endopeptidase
MYRQIFSILLLVVLMSYTSTQASNGDQENKKKGFDTNNLDRSVNPAQDFYKFANGGWVKNNPIPDEYARYGSFEVLQEENNKVLKKILEEAETNKNWEKGSAKQKIGDFYVTGMDSAKIEREGCKPILSLFKEIDAVKNKKDLVKLISEFHASGAGSFFSFYVDVDEKKSDMYVAQLYQGGTGLPDVEYYTKDDDRSKEIREKYVQYVANMFKLVNTDAQAAESISQKIMSIETALAKVSNTRLENRDPMKTYNKMTTGGLQKLTNVFDWNVYFEGMGIKDPQIVVVAQPKFFEGMNKVIDETSLDDLKAYLKWSILRRSASALSSAFVNESFDFNGKFLNGQKVLQPRWKRILANVNGSLGELLGEIYVAEVFPPEAKEKAKNIVSGLLVSMGESIKNNDWMSDATKEQALKKLSTFGVKIGYPDKWTDYSELEISRTSYFKNLQNAMAWAIKDNLKKLGKPIDRTEWGMTPQTVNAYYNPVMNEICFPAAILQPPFFNQNADDAINYGAMGVVIGHEVTHGFDDQGRMYDEKGNLREWWTKEDNEKFKARSQKLVDEYNNFVAIDTFKVNGALTLGENIADLGGLTVSFAAYQKTDEYKKNESIDGFTPTQRFFLGYAQVWANNIRPEALKLRLKTDVHSPGYQRVNGPLMNLPEFFKAFDVKPGDPMRNPDDKIVKIW